MINVEITNVNFITFRILSLYCCCVLSFLYLISSQLIYKLPYSVAPWQNCRHAWDFIPPSRHSLASPISMILSQPRKIQKLPLYKNKKRI